MNLQTFFLLNHCQPSRWLSNFSHALLLIGVALLAGCAPNPALPVRGDEPLFVRTGGRDYFPGGVGMYAFGTAQSRENFENIQLAQYAYTLFASERSWTNIQTYYSFPTANLGALTDYYPLHVRWKLKDGREFILENINLTPIMREYFKSNKILMQWEKENRVKAKVGDIGPMLGFEIKNESVLIKWVISSNLTPVDKRLTSTGAATKWDIVHEQFIVTSLPGNPTQNINFSAVRELKPVK